MKKNFVFFLFVLLMIIISLNLIYAANIGGEFEISPESTSTPDIGSTGNAYMDIVQQNKSGLEDKTDTSENEEDISTESEKTDIGRPSSETEFALKLKEFVEKFSINIILILIILVLILFRKKIFKLFKSKRRVKVEVKHKVEVKPKVEVKHKRKVSKKEPKKKK